MMKSLRSLLLSIITWRNISATISSLKGATDFSIASLRGGSSDGSPESSCLQTRPERGKVLAHLTAETMYEAYCEIRQDYLNKVLLPSMEWKLLNQKDGVEVSLLRHPTDPSCPYVKMTGTIPVPVEDCWNFLLVKDWDRNMPKMDPFYEGVSILGEHEFNRAHMILCRKRTKRIFTFGKRDLVFLSVVDAPLEDGTWVSGSVSVVSDQLPRVSGYTRAFQDSIAFYKPMNNNTRTHLNIICRIDLNDNGEDGAGGCIPMRLYVKTIGYTAVRSVRNMRDAIVKEVQERMQNSSLHKNITSA